MGTQTLACFDLVGVPGNQRDVVAETANGSHDEQADRAASHHHHSLAGDDPGPAGTVPGHTGRLDQAGVLERSSPSGRGTD